MDSFDKRRQRTLELLEVDAGDKSRAGGVDERIRDLVAAMNQHPDLYTTSSCSGRVSVFAEPTQETRAQGKKGGEWVYVTHDLADAEALISAVQARLITGSRLVLRFEPVIVHCECRSIQVALRAVAVARAAGLRESGASGLDRHIAAMRCAIRMEVPIADLGELLVPTSYIERLVELANEKMHRNWARTGALLTAFTSSMLSPQPVLPKPSTRMPSSHMQPAFLPQPQSAPLSTTLDGIPPPPGHTIGAQSNIGTNAHAHVCVEEGRSGAGPPQHALSNGQASRAPGNVQHDMLSMSHASHSQGLGSRDANTTPCGQGSSEAGGEAAIARDVAAGRAANAGIPRVPAVFVRRQEAKALKDALKVLGWLDVSTRVAQAHVAAGQVALPLTCAGFSGLSQQSFCRLGPPAGNAIAPVADPESAIQQVVDRESTIQQLVDPESAIQQVVDPGSGTQEGSAAGGGTTSRRAALEEGPPAVAVESGAGGRGKGPEKGGCQVGTLGRGPKCEGKSRIAESSRPLDLGEAKAVVEGAVETGSACLGTVPVQGLLPKRVLPRDALRTAVLHLLDEKGFAEEDKAALVSELPTKWERLEDLVMLPEQAMLSPQWASLGPSLWPTVATALGARRLARQARVANTGTRDSQAGLLLGEDGWVRHREAGVTYVLDVTRCMFSAGNTSERARMGRLNCGGETVVDLFAGIGYFTIPLLARAGAKYGYACDWNPHALEALRLGLAANDIEGKCEIREGDCRECAPKVKFEVCGQGIADRVLLGLIPSSEVGWAPALAALKPSGGFLHLHHNVKDTEELEWVATTRTRLQTLADVHGRGWEVRVDHVERVKWYAPHIRHIVLDVSVRPAAVHQQ